MSDLRKELERLNVIHRSSTPAPRSSRRRDNAARSTITRAPTPPMPILAAATALAGITSSHRAQSIWEFTWPVLRSHGIECPDSNFWANWPQEQRLEQSKNVVLVKQRTSGDQMEGVCVKAVWRTSIELQILKYLISTRSTMACPPVSRILEPVVIATYSFIVMPPLLPVIFDEMQSVGDALDFARQVLEAVAFLHSHGICHGDLNSKNIMMIPLGVGVSPVQRYLPAARHVQYCLIDFSFAAQFRPGAIRLFTNGIGPMTVAPEVAHLRLFPNGEGYDPFPADIWMLSRMFKFHLIYRKDNLKSLLPLTDAMGKEDPNSRPTASNALHSFFSIARQLKVQTYWESAVRPRSVVQRDHITGAS